MNATATRQLRAHLNESQQAFATRLGLSIRAIGNYENGRLPNAKELVVLIRAAREAGREDLALAFMKDLANKLNTKINLAAPGGAGFFISTKKPK